MAHKRDEWRNGFADGVVSALYVLYYDDPSVSVLYEELAVSHGLPELIAAAKRTGNYESSGLKKFAAMRRRRERMARAGETPAPEGT